MNNIITTIKKELRSIFRDKKTLALLFIYPVMIPLMVILYGNIYENIDTEEQEFLIGINYEPTLDEKYVFDELNIEYEKYSSENEMKEAYKDKVITGYIEYDETVQNYTLHIDTSNSLGMSTADIMYQYLDTYNTILTNRYLEQEGINLETAYNNFTITEKELGNNNYVVVLLLGISITYTILSICISTSNMAIQTTATEKENGTLETILTFPIKKTELILGKYLSSVIIGFISALCSLIFMITSLFIGKYNYTIFENIDINLSFTSIIGSVLTVLAAAIFIAGISLLLTAFSKSYKEAQSQSSFITIVAMIPMFVSILEVEISKLYYLIPVCNINQLLIDLFMNNISITNILITTGSTIIYTIIVIAFIIKAYNSEKILFSN